MDNHNQYGRSSAYHRESDYSLEYSQNDDRSMSGRTHFNRLSVTSTFGGQSMTELSVIKEVCLYVSM